MKKIIIILNLLALTLISCSKKDPIVPVVLSDQNAISSFKLTINNEIVTGDINQDSKIISFNTVGAELSSLKPTVSYSAKATLSPSENVFQNFNNEVTYTVYAENGNPNVYRVVVNNRPLSTENKILSFSVTVNNQTIVANIDQDTKLITFDSDLFGNTALEPSVTISEYASISPQSNIPQNFNNAISYFVTAENGNMTEYQVIANPPQITGLSSIGGVFTANPTLLYVGAEIIISGKYLNQDIPTSDFYLSDGTNSYSLPIIRSETYNSNNTEIYNLYSKIPDNVLTSSTYKVTFQIGNFKGETQTYLDIQSQNVPNPTALNKNIYQRNDTLIITGSNLTDMIAIPSNGSVFLIKSSNNYDYSVNPERTEIRLTLDYYNLFPSYYGRPQEEKIITILGPAGRAGVTIKTIFN
ncbi:MAG: hypothetical protein QM486_12195 [Flavobacteriaceae bacterium]